jgi:hypothetical protein
VTSWSSQRDLLLPAGRAAMESLWLAAFAVAISALAGLPLRLPFAMILALPLAGAVGGRLTLRVPRLAARRWLLVPLGAAALVVWLHAVIAPGRPWTLDAWTTAISHPWELRPEVTKPHLVVAWLLGGYLVCRGLLIGVQPSRAPDVSRWFVGGMIALTLLFAILAGGSVPLAQLPVAELRALLLGYFVVGLATTALAHRRSEPLAPSWLLAIAVPILLVVALAALLAAGIGGLSWLLALISDGLRWLFHAVSWLLHGALVVMSWLASLVPSCAGHRRSSSSGADRPHGAAANDGHALSPGGAVPSIDITPYLMVAIAAGVIFLVLRAFRRRPAPATDPQIDDEIVSLWPWRAWFGPLRTALQALVARMANRRAGAPRSAADRPREARTADDMRWVYRDFLDWAAAQGHDRAPSVTALEFARRLGDSGIVPRGDLDRITTAYVEARYREIALAVEHVTRMRRIVDELPREAARRPRE